MNSGCDRFDISHEAIHASLVWELCQRGAGGTAKGEGRNEEFQRGHAENSSGEKQYFEKLNSNNFEFL